MARTSSGPQVLARWDDFHGGHWGIAGGSGAAKNQWGGMNMAVTRRGGIAPVSQSYLYDVNAASGKVWGMWWGWGIDGLLYFLQTKAGPAYEVRRFDPSDPTAVAITVTDVGATTGAPTYTPDWVGAGGLIYMTSWGDLTYAITPGGPSMTKLTGGSGDAPAGRAICVYGDRMMVGGISDARFGTHASRIVYSGAADFTDWNALSFFDVGGDGKQVRGLYPMRDQLVIVLEDGQVWVYTGTPGVNDRLRRYHGFDQGAGALGAFVPQNGAVDPAQNRVWLYDHANRAITRFNGASVARIPGFGAPSSNRTMSGQTQGALTVLGGPDEVFIDRIAVPVTDGEGGSGSHSLLRHNGAWSVISGDVFKQRA